MRQQRKTRRQGFSLLEVTVGSLMAAILVMLASSVSVNISRSFVAGVADARLATEFRLLTQSLRCDFGGNLPEVRSGPSKQWRWVGRQLVDDDELRLCFDADQDASADWAGGDRIITYLIDNSQIIRNDSGTGNDFIVAENANEMVVTIDGGLIQIDIELETGGQVENFTFTTSDLP